MEPSPSRPSLLERLSAFLLREPEDREQLIELLHSAYERNILDADALTIIEGALQVSDMQVRDVMVPRAQMETISIEEAGVRHVADHASTDAKRFAASSPEPRAPTTESPSGPVSSRTADIAPT